MTRLKINSSICQQPLDILNSSKVSDTTMMLVNVRPVPVYEKGLAPIELKVIFMTAWIYSHLIAFQSR